MRAWWRWHEGHGMTCHGHMGEGKWAAGAWHGLGGTGDTVVHNGVQWLGQDTVQIVVVILFDLCPQSV